MTVYNKQYLMTAGPTPLPPAVSQVMAEPILYHRAPAFVDIYARTLEQLKAVFQTSNEVLMFASSGSGGMESAVANLVAPGDMPLVASCGKFGQRWAELCEAYGANTIHFETEWGEQIDPARVAEQIDAADGAPKVVFTTFSETSTGVVNDIKAINEVVRERGAILVVDAVSGMGAVSLPTDEWGIDVVVAGSQKALMSPPGLGFAAVSDRAMGLAASARERGARSYYFDWDKTRKGQLKEPPDSPFTSPVSLIRALSVALDLIDEETLPKVYERHALLGQAAREAVKGLGLEIFGPEDEKANVVTAIKVPDGVDGAKIPKTMRDKYGFTIAGGQAQLKGKIVRIAHCGYYGAFDIIATFAALEMTLDELGADITLGSGVAAAQKVFREAGVPAGAPA